MPCAELVHKVVGETELRVSRVFAAARKLAPCFILLDNLDTVLGHAESHDEDNNNDVDDVDNDDSDKKDSGDGEREDNGQKSWEGSGGEDHLRMSVADSQDPVTQKRSPRRLKKHHRQSRR